MPYLSFKLKKKYNFEFKLEKNITVKTVNFNYKSHKNICLTGQKKYLNVYRKTPHRVPTPKYTSFFKF